ncbi:MAG: phage head closure protein [Selenomonadaceae bacterium]|nr:phage head closure protein [Selenomonadaceae bacterium]
MIIQNIGRLNKKVSVISGEAAEYGGFDTVKDNVLYENIWADIIPMKGREGYETMKGRGNNVIKPIKNEEEVKIIIRYRDNITEGAKVFYKKRIFNIKSIVDPDMEHSFLELYCTEKKRGATPSGNKLPKESEVWEP